MEGPLLASIPAEGEEGVFVLVRFFLTSAFSERCNLYCFSLELLPCPLVLLLLLCPSRLAPILFIILFCVAVVLPGPLAGGVEALYLLS